MSLVVLLLVMCMTVQSVSCLSLHAGAHVSLNFSHTLLIVIELLLLVLVSIEWLFPLFFVVVVDCVVIRAETIIHLAQSITLYHNDRLFDYNH